MDLARAPTPAIISVSRRTDIPAFYTPWFLERVRAGWCAYRHPFSARWFRVSLLPEDVIGFVFWTRNLGPLLPHLPELRERGFRWYCHLTITGLPRPIEGRVPSPERAIEHAWRFGEACGPSALVWRFDPICLTSLTPQSWVLETFDRLATGLQGATARCYTSFVQPYSRTVRNLAAAGVELVPTEREARVALAGQIARRAAELGVQLHACCNDELVGELVAKGHCVDPQVLRENGVPAERLTGVRPAPSRRQCGCYRSHDIGAFETCPARCLYCYAVANHERAAANRRAHDPAAESLTVP